MAKHSRVYWTVRSPAGGYDDKLHETRREALLYAVGAYGSFTAKQIKKIDRDLREKGYRAVRVRIVEE